MARTSTRPRRPVPARRSRRRRPLPGPGAATSASKRSPSSARRRSKQSFLRISLAARWHGARAPAGADQEDDLGCRGCERRSRSTRAVPKKPVAPVTKKRLPARASRTRVTGSVYHMVSDRVEPEGRSSSAPEAVRPEPAAGSSAPARVERRSGRPTPGRRTSERILDAALASFSDPGLRGDLARRPGGGPRGPQADHPLLVPVAKRSCSRP